MWGSNKTKKNNDHFTNFANFTSKVKLYLAYLMKMSRNYLKNYSDRKIEWRIVQKSSFWKKISTHLFLLNQIIGKWICIMRIQGIGSSSFSDVTGSWNPSLTHLHLNSPWNVPWEIERCDRQVRIAGEGFHLPLDLNIQYMSAVAKKTATWKHRIGSSRISAHLRSFQA